MTSEPWDDLISRADLIRFHQRGLDEHGGLEATETVVLWVADRVELLPP